MEDALDRRAAHLAVGERVVGHLLDHVEDVAVLAFVLVDGHGARLSQRVLTFRPLAFGADGRHRRPLDRGPTLDEIVALCKRRGFIFPSSEIYGGLGSTYDYGHYGVLLKNNVKAEWWRAMLQERDDIVALDSAIIQHPRVWEASGHLAGFTDPLVDCRQLQAALPRRQARGRRSAGASRRSAPARAPTASSPSRASST